MDQNKKEDTAHYMPLCMCLGMSIGTGIGVAFDNMTTFMCIGMSLGVAIGAMLDAKKRKESKDPKDVNEDDQIQD